MGKRSADKSVDRKCWCPECEKTYSYPVTLETHKEFPNLKKAIIMTCYECLEADDLADDADREMFGDESDYLDEDVGNK